MSLRALRRQLRSNRAGFTLLELMVALTVLSSITIMVWRIFRNSAQVREEMERRAELTTMGRVAAERIRREVSLAFMSENVSPTDSWRTMFEGQDRDPFDELTFTSLSHTPLYINRKECDQTEISYFERDDPDSSYQLLMHREAARIDGEPDRGGVVHVLASSVKSLNFRYFDDTAEDGEGEWVDEWDTEAGDTQGRLPRMVEIQLVLVDPEGGEHPFFTRTFISQRNH